VRVAGVTAGGGAMRRAAAGEHAISARQAGYRAVPQPTAGVAGQIAEVTIALERVSSVLAVVPAPAGVQVIIDGVSHGKTENGPPPPDYAEKAARAGVPASELSQVKLVAEMQPGADDVDFRPTRCV